MHNNEVAYSLINSIHPSYLLDTWDCWARPQAGVPILSGGGGPNIQKSQGDDIHHNFFIKSYDVSGHVISYSCFDQLRAPATFGD